MKVVKHVKSNAIVLVKDEQTVGIGPGQPNRITSANIAIKQAGEKAVGACSEEPKRCDAQYPQFQICK